MGIVNSFVNQIGREIGRDVYRNLTSKKTKRIDFESFEIKEPLLERIKNFEILKDEGNTLKELTNIIEQSENSNPEDFEWQNLFIEIDNKIDFCKENLDSQFKQKLDDLDALNASNYEIIKQKHIDYMYQVIDLLNQTKNKLISKNLFVAGLASFIGLRSLYVNGKFIPSIYRLILLAIIGSIFYFGFLAFRYPINNAGNLPTTTNQEIDTIKNSGIALMVCALLFYVIHIGLGFYKVYQFKKQKEENQESIILFENYVEEIK
jgi:hypothetical protein